MTDVFTFSGDQHNPMCPLCSANIMPFAFTENPSVPFEATCTNGHTHTFQYEEDDHDNQEADLY